MFHSHISLDNLYFPLLFSASPSLRLGLDLCADEKVYLRQRKPKVLAGLSAFLQDQEDQPESLSDVSQNCNCSIACNVMFNLIYSSVSNYLPDDVRWRISSHDCLLWGLQSLRRCWTHWLRDLHFGPFRILLVFSHFIFTSGLPWRAQSQPQNHTWNQILRGKVLASPFISALVFEIFAKNHH